MDPARHTLFHYFFLRKQDLIAKVLIVGPQCPKHAFEISGES